MSKHTHAHWSSRFAFVLAATGSAVGLGNIWKFPYMVGESGGAAFVLVYLVCIALIGLPILVAEWYLGRRGQKNPIATMASIATQNARSRGWAVVGAFGTLAGFLILSFYSVVGGWSLYYTLEAARGAFADVGAEDVEAIFGDMLSDPWLLLVWHSVFMALVLGILMRGVRSGLESAVRLLMPILMVLLVILVGYGLTTEGFGEALAYMFAFDVAAITGSTLIAALGHAFFTLSLGMGVMMAYGSYLGGEVNLFRTARTVVILDTVIALAAGLAIFPVVFSNGLDAGSGPGLIFVTLPIAFGNIAGGYVVGLFFFLLLTFAALTSAISVLEPTVEFLEERTPLNRAMAALVPGLAAWALGIAALLSLNVWSTPLPLVNLNVFDALDTLTSKVMLPLTGLGVVVFLAWFVDGEAVRRDLGLAGARATAWRMVTRYVAPLGVIAVFVGGLFGLG